MFWLDEHYQEKFRLDALANELGKSRSYVSRKFHAETGEKIHDYLNTLRLRKACECLLHTDSSVRDIAAQTGFSDVTWFISAFKKGLARRRCSTGRTIVRFDALTHGAEGSPQINASTEQSPRPSGERVRVREHTAVVVIPFTLCSLLLCNDMTGERAGVAQSPPPRRPGLPAVNRRFAVPSAYSFRLIGYGRRQRPCKAALSAHPCASPRPEGKRLSDLQPDRGIADSPQSFRKQLYCFCIKNYWGSLSPRGEGKINRSSCPALIRGVTR